MLFLSTALPWKRSWSSMCCYVCVLSFFFVS